jgi:8-oxo-dGTP pyrophosphatase MutT (NUDIX family)
MNDQPRHPTPVITCTIYHQNSFLVIRRHDAAKKFGGLWAFPGGKVEVGETLIGALRREVAEETQLALHDRFWLINSYYYGNSLGLHVAVESITADVQCEPGVEHQWLTSLEELQKLPRIPGIDYHIVRGAELRAQLKSGMSLDATDYTPDKYLNGGTIKL